MTYVGIIASAALHVGGLFLLLTARAPEPLIPMGSDTAMAVDIISVDEYNALTSRAPTPSTVAAPEPPRAPVLADADPVPDALDEPPPAPEPSVELAMRLPEPVVDALPEPEAPEPDAPSVTAAPAPKPLVLDDDALADREVDPADLGPPDDVEVAIAPPAPKPPRGVMDALPQIDTSSDEPPPPAETEGEGEKAESAPEPAPAPDPVETAAAAEEDLAPLSTPLPSRKPRGSLAVASAEEPRRPAAAPAPEPEPAPAPATPEAAPEPQVDEAALAEAQRRFMEMVQAEERAAEERAAEQRRLEEDRARVAALVEEERRRREEAARAEQDRVAEQERRAAELAERREQERLAERLRADQAEAERLARAELESRRRAEEEARQRALRQQQLAALNADSSPEDRASNIVDTPAAPPQDSFLGGDSALASILGAANNAAQSARTGPSFGQGRTATPGVSLTAGETQAVLDQLRRCWRVDTVSANARNLVVTFRAEIRQNGFVNQNSITLLEPRPTPPDFQIAVDRARTALQDMRCQPFALPPQKYNAWRDIVIRFDPAQMVLQ